MSEKVSLCEGQILTGPLFSEPMRVETVRAIGPDTWVVGLVGTQSEQFRKRGAISRASPSWTRSTPMTLTVEANNLEWVISGHDCMR